MLFPVHILIPCGHLLRSVHFAIYPVEVNKCTVIATFPLSTPPLKVWKKLGNCTMSFNRALVIIWHRVFFYNLASFFSLFHLVHPWSVCVAIYLHCGLHRVLFMF
jgi:hypothetical protein